MALVLMWALKKLCERIFFFGEFSFMDTGTLHEQLWLAVTETFFAMTMFRDEFDSRAVILFAGLLLVKWLHWALYDRVAHMSLSPHQGFAFHAQIVTLSLLLASIDIFSTWRAMSHVSRYGPSMLLFAVLFVSLLFGTVIKYIIGSTNLRQHTDSPLDLALDLTQDFFKLLLHGAFFLALLSYYGLPIHTLCDLFLTARSFTRRAMAMIMYIRAVRRLNRRFVNPTTEELQAGDPTCIICREDMDAAGSKKLPCGHIFHFSCLRPWLERQQKCPTCRVSVLSGAEEAAAQAAPAAPGAPGAAPVPRAQQPPAPAARAAPVAAAAPAVPVAPAAQAAPTVQTAPAAPTTADRPSTPATPGSSSPGLAGQFEPLDVQPTRLTPPVDVTSVRAVVPGADSDQSSLSGASLASPASSTAVQPPASRPGTGSAARRHNHPLLALLQAADSAASDSPISESATPESLASESATAEPDAPGSSVPPSGIAEAPAQAATVPPPVAEGGAPPGSTPIARPASAPAGGVATVAGTTIRLVPYSTDRYPSRQLNIVGSLQIPDDWLSVALQQGIMLRPLGPGQPSGPVPSSSSSDSLASQMAPTTGRASP
ncbi:hypothetical protein H696_00824 [Fonticula alba]|uniref:RING-type E3 ubiquitin transferase n=1 Tax=Fonticula alba TaxID=691883 RepID=A0A058ZID6_FONAL|nr:hypothetical protein H696_00824 [Fonticula alba]KCV73282.1 hypothetical protein H696_00824 [Fonticula alba]|eukprot:XP_009492983.1 hypothetical protein H696_00824 [Fonticula alba]